ncbi:MAG: adenylate/guanylate cyclase domain-containing protein [Alphaproteobacteria bacterium]|nr:adenylate/guanylate cyclase domain-containing protein [Alphaproteobacteria bacterium]
MTDVAAIVAWLIDGARSAPTPQHVLGDLCRRLVEAGVPLARVAVFVRTLHPHVAARRLTWRPDAPVEFSEAPYDLFDSDTYHQSPISRVYAEAVTIRRRLAEPDCPIDYPVLADLRAEGMTDYLAQPLVFSDGAIHAVSWATAAPGGFRDTDVAALEAVVRPLTRIAEIWALRRTATNLLEAYVGKRSGARILAGHVRRGDVETIEAALWYSDMRDFTALNEDLAPADLIALLNDYFGAVAAATAPHGGEVLQFIGDAALVVFPIGAGGRRAACAAALAAAHDAFDAIATLNRESGRPAIRFGIGLHVGAVSWGNVGGVDRLGLNVIGPSVNRTARIETLTKQAGVPLLLSEDFAVALERPCRLIGRFPLKGVAAPQAVYAPEPQAIDTPD